MERELRSKSPEELVDGAKAGSSEAFSELVRRYEGPLYNFLFARCGSSEDAEELCQEAFLRAWRKLDLYRPDWSFSTWLFTLARRLHASRARAGRRPPAGEEALAEVCVAHDPSEGISACEERENLWTLAARVLPEEQRAALWLRYAEDLPVDEIARILGRPRVTVRVILFRARRELARHVELDAAGVGLASTGGRA